MAGLGWGEILLILVIALIIFGPRKLPELGKSLGQSLAQFRRASEDFKRTWEEEVEMEKRRLQSFVPDPFEPTPESEPTPEYQSESPPYEPAETYEQEPEQTSVAADFEAAPAGEPVVSADQAQADSQGHEAKLA